MQDQRLKEAKCLGHSHTPIERQSWNTFSSPLPCATTVNHKSPSFKAKILFIDLAVGKEVLVELGHRTVKF